MINYDTIISAYQDRPTLMQWLKKVEEALKGASATSFSVNKKGSATISFQIDFEDGTSLESGEIILQQGESVTGASIVNGHLILTLSNGDELDAGNLGAVSGFSIDASQHLIVTYQDGTTNDLGAIFNGNVNISGDLNATGKISGGEIVETMTGYSFVKTDVNAFFNVDFASVVKNGNKLTFVISGTTKDTETPSSIMDLGGFIVPNEIASQLVSSTLGGNANIQMSSVSFYLTVSDPNPKVKTLRSVLRPGNKVSFVLYNLTDDFTASSVYQFRVEATFLLGENMAA